MRPAIGILWAVSSGSATVRGAGFTPHSLSQGSLRCLHPPSPLRIAGYPTCPIPISHPGAELGDDGVWRDHNHPGNWTPWTHPPFCANSSYWVFTNAAFQGGRGFSIVATPEEVASAQNILEAAFVASPSFHIPYTARVKNATSPTDTANLSVPYTIAGIPGKGKGVISVRSIRRGEVIMTDYASVLASVSFPSRVKRAQGHALLRRAVEQLPNPGSILDLSRINTEGPPMVEDIIRINAFGVTIDEGEFMGLFPVTSRINHACKPNAYTRFSETTLSQRVIAFRDIQPGEEITISYSEFGLLHQERQQVLLRRWGFRCTCDLCKVPPEELAASDSRRQRAKGLRDEILAHVNAGQYRSAIEGTRLLMEVNDKEGLVAHLGDHYEMLARLYLNSGDLEAAEEHTRLALEEFRRFGGVVDGFDESVGEMEAFLERFEARRRAIRRKAG